MTTPQSEAPSAVFQLRVSSILYFDQVGPDSSEKRETARQYLAALGAKGFKYCTSYCVEDDSVVFRTLGYCGDEIEA